MKGVDGNFKWKRSPRLGARTHHWANRKIKSSIEGQVLECESDSGRTRTWKRIVQRGHFILILKNDSLLDEGEQHAALDCAPGWYWPSRLIRG